jgi:hypothetical protein
VFQGEKVVKAVYDALTSNKETWESTILLITYDEHGGLYDHVTPPATVNPDGKVSGVPPFNFERLGVRVPAVVVSPYIPKGTIIHNKVFDHTSLIATASKLFIKTVPTPWLTERDRRANTFEDCLTLSAPRAGKVNIPQPRAVLNESAAATATRATASTAAPVETSHHPLSEFQSIMVQQAFSLDSAQPRALQTDGLVDWAKCAKHIHDKLTNKDGFHIVHGGVAPGSGIAGGVGYSRRKAYESWRVQFNSSARISVRKYWEVDSNLRLTKSSNTFTASDAGGPSGDLKINVYGLVKDMQRLDYFGIGPETGEGDRAVFHYREGGVGADLSQPVRSWMDVGGAVESIFPHITTIENPTVRSVERVFTEAGAPGINSQPNFMHYVGFAGLYTPGQPEGRKLDYKFFYHFFHDWQDNRYSFRRFEADLKHKFPFAKKNEFRFRARVPFSETNGGQRVPFYLMETLGGSNIRGDDTLRGFRDYRFRDRDLVLLQTEYLRRVYGPLELHRFL